MIRRKQVLAILDGAISVLNEFRQIVAVVPDYETFLKHLGMFVDFIGKENKSR